MGDISIRAMAAALGVAKSQVGRDKLAGMPMHSPDAARAWCDANHDLSRTKDGRIDRALSQTPAPIAEAQKHTPLGNLPPPSSDASAPEPDAPADENTTLYRESRAQKERLAAERGQIELDQLRGRLVDKQDVARLRFTEFRSLRDALGNVGARIKAAVASETDELKCEQLIDAEISARLTDFADTILSRGVTQDSDDEDDPA